MNGEYDEATDDVMRPYFNNIDKVKWVVMADCAHLAYWEEPEKYISVMAQFLAQ